MVMFFSQHLAHSKDLGLLTATVAKMGLDSWAPLRGTKKVPAGAEKGFLISH